MTFYFTTKIAALTALSFCITFFLLPSLSKFATKIGLLDYPNERKIHSKPTPRVGGLGIIITLFIVIALFIPIKHLHGFIGSIVLLTFVGFIDDLSDLNHRWKFVVQISIVFSLAFCGFLLLYSFGDLLGIGSIDFYFWAIPITIFSVVGVINAMNMIDGTDGLFCSLSIVVFSSFGILSYITNQTTMTLLNFILCGALLGFLKYNWPPAKFFMGDAGSLPLGFITAFIAIVMTQGSERIYPVTSLLILALPIIDTVGVMLLRLLHGKNPFHPDKTHIHHFLLAKGFNRKKIVVIMTLFSMFFSVIGITGMMLHVSEFYLFIIFISCFVLYFSIFFRKEKNTVIYKFYLD